MEDNQFIITSKGFTFIHDTEKKFIIQVPHNPFTDGYPTVILSSENNVESNLPQEPSCSYTNLEHKNDCTVGNRSELKDDSSTDIRNINFDSDFESSEVESARNASIEEGLRMVAEHRAAILSKCSGLSEYDVLPGGRANGSVYENVPHSASAVTKSHVERTFTHLPLCIIPQYKNYQLLGDFHLFRFSEQNLKYSNDVEYTVRGSGWCNIGYCVDRQLASELEQSLRNREYRISSKVIMLIGTYDLLSNVIVPSTCASFKSILQLLKEAGVTHTVILTVPPIPRLAKDRTHWDKLEALNNFIMKTAEDGKIFVLDLASFYISYNNTVSLEYFEKRTQHFPEADLINLNSDGLKVLKFFLDSQYFDKMELK